MNNKFTNLNEIVSLINESINHPMVVLIEGKPLSVGLISQVIINDAMISIQLRTRNGKLFYHPEVFTFELIVSFTILKKAISDIIEVTYEDGTKTQIEIYL